MSRGRSPESTPYQPRKICMVGLVGKSFNDLLLQFMCLQHGCQFIFFFAVILTLLWETHCHVEFLIPDCILWFSSTCSLAFYLFKFLNNSLISEAGIGWKRKCCYLLILFTDMHSNWGLYGPNQRSGISAWVTSVNVRSSMMLAICFASQGQELQLDLGWRNCSTHTGVLTGDLTVRPNVHVCRVLKLLVNSRILITYKLTSFGTFFHWRKGSACTLPLGALTL